MDGITPITTLVVDDEPLARRGLRLRLEREPDFAVVAEAGTAEAGVAELRARRPLAVFMDIEMPGPTGMEMLRRLPAEERPCVVFVTAFDEYAAEAFDVRAVDYLLKPIGDDRFAETLRRLRLAVRGMGAPIDPDRAARSHARPAPSRLERIQVRDGDVIRFVDVGGVDWIEGAGNYLRIHYGNEHALIRMPMKEMAARLPSDRFARIHRSTIVNLDRVRRLEPYAAGEYVVILSTGTRLRVSRTYRDPLLSVGT